MLKNLKWNAKKEILSSRELEYTLVGELEKKHYS